VTFTVSILGSGAAIPLTHRNPSAQLIDVHGQLFLFDCAEGTQVQLRRQHFRIQKIDHIFITHLHGDHYFGLMGMITTQHLLGRENELHIYAYYQLEEIIKMHLHASQTILRYPLVFHAIDPEEHKTIMEGPSASVSTIPMSHNFPTCGFLIREKQAKPNIRKDFLEGKSLKNSDYARIKAGEDYVAPDGTVYPNNEITLAPRPSRAYAYCTDTAYDESIIPVVKGVDLLYHEATFMEDRIDDAKAKYHATAKQAAMIAKLAGVKKLALGHFSARYKELDGLLEEAKEVFPNSVLAEEGITLSL